MIRLWSLCLAASIGSVVPAADVALIERRGDSLRNGVIAGLAIGGICAFTCAIELRGGALAQAMAVNALIPVAIDALHRGRTRVWPARTRP
jgi:hypothetical protein